MVERFSWSDAEGPDDYDWDDKYRALFEDSMSSRDDFDPETSYEDPSFAEAAAAFDRGFVQTGADDNRQFARDWFFDWMIAHGYNANDFDWSAWRDAHYPKGQPIGA